MVSDDNSNFTDTAFDEFKTNYYENESENQNEEITYEDHQPRKSGKLDKSDYDQPKKGTRKAGNKEGDCKLDDQPKKGKRKAGNKGREYDSESEDQPKKGKRKSRMENDYESVDQPKKSKRKTGNGYSPELRSIDFAEVHAKKKKDKRAFRKEVEARRMVVKEVR